MTLNRLWLADEDEGQIDLVSNTQTTDGVSADIARTQMFPEREVVPQLVLYAIEITGTFGTQASVDFDLEYKFGTVYVAVARRNVTGLGTFLIYANDGITTPTGVPIGYMPNIHRWRRTFNTPGATPTVTFQVRANGWGLRNMKHGWPGMRV